MPSIGHLLTIHLVTDLRAHDLGNTVGLGSAVLLQRNHPTVVILEFTVLDTEDPIV